MQGEEQRIATAPDWPDSVLQQNKSGVSRRATAYNRATACVWSLFETLLVWLEVKRIYLLKVHPEVSG